MAIEAGAVQIGPSVMRLCNGPWIRSDALAQPVLRVGHVWWDPKAGDVNLRRAVCQAATVMMHRGRATWLRPGPAQVARRCGRRRAMVARARRIGGMLRRMWRDGTALRAEPPVAADAALTPEASLGACLSPGCEVPPRDAVPTMPWSGLLPADRFEHANETGRSELHRTSIMLAASTLTTDRRMPPG